MELLDSRRLTGPTRFWDLPGAVVDLVPSQEAGIDSDADFEVDMARFAECWMEWARRILDAVGWHDQKTTYRIFGNGLSVVLSAPIDALYAATEVNEWAVAAAQSELAGEPVADLDEAARALRSAIEEESSPALSALQQAAAREAVLFLSDDDFVSIGVGRTSRVWPVTDLPAPSDVDWSAVSDLPIAAITGTNGKSTTVRLLATMAEAAGLTAGVSSTDWIRVGDQTLDLGDYSGPGGARTILRDPRVDVALLETARGGLNRRGLAVPKLDVGAVTNIGADHLGEHGSTGLEDLADVKFTVLRTAQHIVLNLEDPLLAEYGGSVQRQRLTWCSLDEEVAALVEHVDAGGTACVLRDGALVLIRDREATEIARLEDVPSTLGGAATHNVQNALTAIGVANALGFTPAAMAKGLAEFGTRHSDNPGRLNRFDFGGLEVVVDFAHNPDGVRALLELARRLAPKRYLVVIGQAGDRDDDALRELAGVVAPFKPDLILIKELHAYLRGRAVGEIPVVIEQELFRLDLDSSAVERVDSEFEALQRSLEWGESGDLVLLITHSDRDAVLDCLNRLHDEGWRPGEPLPGWFPSV